MSYEIIFVDIISYQAKMTVGLSLPDVKRIILSKTGKAV